jgi:threonine aldolase
MSPLTFFFIASVFFCTYDTIKKIFSKQVDPVYLPVIHMGAACAGEIVSQNREFVLKHILPQKTWSESWKNSYMYATEFL